MHEQIQSETLAEMARRFALAGPCLFARPFGNGHIHDTFLITCQNGSSQPRYILQRFNSDIFKEPETVMANIHRVTKHIQGRLAAQGATDPQRRCLNLISARDGHYLVRDEQARIWRCYDFIERSRSHEIVPSASAAREAAAAYGNFQKLLSDIPPPRLSESIKDFHYTPGRVQALRDAVAADRSQRASACRDLIDFALARQDYANRLENLRERGELPERITHNDTKFNNILFDSHEDQAICVVDLDTVMPGLVSHDFGDMVRTTATRAAEDEADLDKIGIDLDLFGAIAEGYLSTADFLIPAERETLAFSSLLITYEIGVRFLTDHLNGDVYFKIRQPGHNLTRARSQFRLLQSMEANLPAMEKRIHECT